MQDTDDCLIATVRTFSLSFDLCLCNTSLLEVDDRSIMGPYLNRYKSLFISSTLLSRPCLLVSPSSPASSCRPLLPTPVVLCPLLPLFCLPVRPIMWTVRGSSSPGGNLRRCSRISTGGSKSFCCKRTYRTKQYRQALILESERCAYICSLFRILFYMQSIPHSPVYLVLLLRYLPSSAICIFLISFLP